jgi:hypothetical protein
MVCDISYFKQLKTRRMFGHLEPDLAMGAVQEETGKDSRSDRKRETFGS